MGTFRLLLALLLALAATVESTTIHVPGDQPTIQAGIDTAVNGDTVLVADGTYTGDGNRDIEFGGRAIVVMSENSARYTILDCEGNSRGFNFWDTGEDSMSVVDGFTIRNGGGNNAGGAIQMRGSAPRILNCVFTINTANYGGAVYINSSPHVIIRGCSFVGNHAFGRGAAIYFQEDNQNQPIEACLFFANSSVQNYPPVTNANVTLSCCNIFGNAPGDWIGDIATQAGSNGNLSIYPELCDWSEGDLTLGSNSPCLPENNSCGILIGALGYGCDDPEPYWPFASNISYEPLADDSVISPDFSISWLYDDTAAGSQVGYEIEVGIDNDWTSAEMWASGPVMSSDTSVSYGGAPLSNFQTYFLRIRVCDDNGFGIWTTSSFSMRLATTFSVPGDKPTIQAGVDAARNGDTVELADGIYSGSGNRNISLIDKEIVVRSVNGPATTIIDPDSLCRGFLIESSDNLAPTIEGLTIRNGWADDYGGAVYCYGAALVIVDCVFLNNTSDDLAGAMYFDADNTKLPDGTVDVTPSIVGCTFVGNRTVRSGSAIVIASGVSLEVDRTVFYANKCSTDAPLYPGGVVLTCCNIYGNAPGDWIAGITVQANMNGNFSAHPLICDRHNGDMHVASGSPCLPENNTCNLLVGALGVGCDEPEPFWPLARNLSYEPFTDGHITSPIPTIVWQYTDSSTTTQVGYELQVGTDDDWMVAEMWETGLVLSADTSVVYSGLSLTNFDSYHVRVRVHSSLGAGAWTMGSFEIQWPIAIRVPGDKPTIQEGVDSAFVGDTVLVAGGTYTGSGNKDITFNGEPIVVRSENGPSHTVIDCEGNGRAFSIRGVLDSGLIIEGFTIINGAPGNQGGAMECFNASPEIKYCIFANNTADYGAALYVSGNPDKNSGDSRGGSSKVFNCTFAANTANTSAGVLFSQNNGALSYFENCILYGNNSPSGGPIHGTDVALYCCDLFANSDGDWVGDIAAQAAIPGNFSEDPLFEDAATGNYSLMLGSPCLPDNSECGVLIGALGHLCCEGDRGNVLLDPDCGSSDQTVDIADLTNLIDHMFISYASYCCLEEADIAPAIYGQSADGAVDIADLTALIDHLFINFPPLPACP